MEKKIKMQYIQKRKIRKFCTQKNRNKLKESIFDVYILMKVCWRLSMKNLKKKKHF